MPIELKECVSLSEGSRPAGRPRVDRENGIIFDVKALGWKSANGREYLPEGVAAALYEGRRVCVGHVRTPGDRSPLDTYGLLEGVSKRADGVYAERLQLLNPKGEFEQRLLAAADRAPHLFGLSHTARGAEKPGSGGRVIESVQSVESVDLVTDPATVSGLYESRATPVKKKLRDLAESLKASRPHYARALTEMAEAGVMSPDAEMEAPAGDATSTDHEQALKAGFRAAIVAALDDESLDMKAKLSKIKEILKAEEKMLGGNGDKPAEETPAEESRRREAANLREENARLKARDLLRTAADEAGVKVGKSLLESVRPNISEADAKALVAELQGAGAGSQRPRSAAPAAPAKQGGARGVQEGKTNDGEIPADPKARAAWIKRGA